MFPPKDRLTICFAHVAYQLQQRFVALTPRQQFRGARPRDLDRRISEADVLVVSGLWHDGLLASAAGCVCPVDRRRDDQFPTDKLGERGIRLASAQGVNARAVSEHAMALILALVRRLPEARDNQAKNASGAA